MMTLTTLLSALTPSLAAEATVLTVLIGLLLTQDLILGTTSAGETARGNLIVGIGALLLALLFILLVARKLAAS